MVTAASGQKRGYTRRQPQLPVSENRRDLDAFLKLVKQTKAPQVRDFLMNVYDTAPTLFGNNGIAVKSGDMPAALPRRTPVTRRQQDQAEDFA